MPDRGAVRQVPLPNLVVIGAMKCGTTSLHRYLDAHPDVSMSNPKELNFFFGPDTGDDGSPWRSNWHRGTGWYAGRFGDGPVRGESSPGYTSPDHPEVAERMARVVPAVRLIFMVRDPVARAVSQYRHHVADGDEDRRPEEALLDPDSQYVSRGRYYDRLEPFLRHFDRAQIAVFAQEQLLADRASTLRAVFRFAGVDDNHWSDTFDARWNTARQEPPDPPRWLVERLSDLFRDDVERLRAFTGQAFREWTV